MASNTTVINNSNKQLEELAIWQKVAAENKFPLREIPFASDNCELSLANHFCINYEDYQPNIDKINEVYKKIKYPTVHIKVLGPSIAYFVTINQKIQKGWFKVDKMQKAMCKFIPQEDIARVDLKLMSRYLRKKISDELNSEVVAIYPDYYFSLDGEDFRLESYDPNFLETLKDQQEKFAKIIETVNQNLRNQFSQTNISKIIGIFLKKKRKDTDPDSSKVTKKPKIQQPEDVHAPTASMTASSNKGGIQGISPTAPGISTMAFAASLEAGKAQGYARKKH